MPRWPTKEERFSSYVSVENNGCHNFNSSKAGNGYGVIHWNGKQQYAHRIAWTMQYGPIPNEMCVLHTCDNPACVNIEHLFLGTKKDNTQDMILKNRNGFGHKLTIQQVSKIKNILMNSVNPVYKSIAKEFGVSEATIRRIDYRELWSNIAPEES